MSSMSSDWVCTQCKSTKGYQEDFNDSEIGYILECKECNYMEVYREDVNTGKIIENYTGYEHSVKCRICKIEPACNTYRTISGITSAVNECIDCMTLTNKEAYKKIGLKKDKIKI